jgi:TolB-like protein/DNA-binding winged helix-turn-helix (wHTH) protein/tetratricopeptide (TPR) repeat protein
MNASPEFAAGPALEQSFQLRDLTVDTATGDVSGPGGHEQLDPKVAEVLVYLARHAGQVVLREDLLTRVWPKTVVSDDALSRCVYELRRQLSRAAGDENFKGMLETLPKRGYRLNGQVTWLTTPVAAPPAARSARRFAVLGALAVAAVLLWIGERIADRPQSPPPTSPSTVTHSIAVLPFIDLSEGQDQRFLSDGLAEEILGRLAHSGKLRVIARTSSFAFRDQPVDVPRIAAMLNVSHVLEGSVRRSGDRVRITAHLIDTASNSRIWSDTYERTLGDLFVVQDEIATSVARALQIALSDTARSGQPASASAYESFLQGEFFYNRRAPGDIERSVKYFRKALATEPDYARAWAALSGAYALLYWEGGPSAKGWNARQGEAAHRAVELDPDLAVAHARLAQYYFDVGDRDRAQNHLHRAKSLGPEDPSVLAFATGLVGRDHTIETAVALQHRVVARDPLAVVHRVNLGHLLVRAGRLDEAESEYRKAQELSPGAGHDIAFGIARILILQQRHDEAYAAIAGMPAGTVRDHGLALLHHAPGRQEDAEGALRRLRVPPIDVNEYLALTEAYALRGRPDDAFASLHSARQKLEREEVAALSRVWALKENMAVSPFLIPLHADHRWSAFMAD